MALALDWSGGLQAGTPRGEVVIMRLTGQDIDEFTKIICESFDRDELAYLVRTKLNTNLDDTVAPGAAMKLTAFRLIDDLNRRERVLELIQVVRNARPNVAAVQEFCNPVRDQKNRVETSEALRKATAAFNNGFQERNELFKYLNAYKELHDVLHKLQSFHPKVEAALADRKTNPSQPLAEEVSDFLQEQVEIAGENVKEIEFPDRPPAWIAKLATAVEVITGSDVAKMPRQVERLKTLPFEGLGAMNEKLFENARRLQPKQLIGSLNDILSALGTDGKPTTAKLRGEVDGFRSLCAELDDLINAHNLCQKIDDSLREAAGLPSVNSPGELSDWGDAKKSLDDLALQRKNDRRVQRTNEAAKWFEAANQAQAFRTLMERFDDLFMETDKALLKVTNKLPRKAMALHTALEGFQ
jgi:hypothetical protein